MLRTGRAVRDLAQLPAIGTSQFDNDNWPYRFGILFNMVQFLGSLH